LVLESDHPAAKYLDKGVKAHQMTYLSKSDKPIPILTDEGDVIFRSATPKSMQEGKWQHPGIKGKNFIERGVEKAREKVKERIAQSIKDRIKSRLQGK
jgi:hypothetical protein